MNLQTGLQISYLKTQTSAVSDLNIHINDRQDTEAYTFCDNKENMGLDQHEDFTTVKCGNILVLVFTDVTGKLRVTKCTPGPFLSDHWTVECQISVMKKESKYKEISDRDLTKSTSMIW